MNSCRPDLEAEDAFLPFRWVALPDANVSSSGGLVAAWSDVAGANDDDDDNAGCIAIDLTPTGTDGSDLDGNRDGRFHTDSSGAGDILRCDGDALRRGACRGNGAVDEQRDGGTEIYPWYRQP